MGARGTSLRTNRKAPAPRGDQLLSGRSPRRPLPVFGGLVPGSTAFAARVSSVPCASRSSEVHRACMVEGDFCRGSVSPREPANAPFASSRLERHLHANRVPIADSRVERSAHSHAIADPRTPTTIGPHNGKRARSKSDRFRGRRQRITK